MTPRRVFNPCPSCGGDGVIESGYYEIDRSTGAAMCESFRCDLCGGRGDLEEDADPVTLEDLEQIEEEISHA